MAKPERVTNNGNGAKTHGGRRDHRTQEQTEKRVEHPCRDRYPERIVREGKKQILTYVAHGGPAELTGPNDAAQGCSTLFSVGENSAQYRDLLDAPLGNEVPLPLHFNPRVSGVTV